MIIMKKFLSIALSLLTCLVLFVTPAAAAEAVPNEAEPFGTENVFSNEYEIMSTTAVHDLTNDGAYFINESVSSERSVTLGNFKTNTTKIYVYFNSAPSASYKVELLDAQGVSLQEITKSVETERAMPFKFNNLTASKTYKVKVENLGQKDCVIMGSIRDGLL